MACTFLAKNGKPSILYDDLAKKYNSETALRTYLNSKQLFITGKELDENGELSIQDLEETGNIKKALVEDNSDKKLTYYTTKAEEIADRFKANGVDVEVQIDFEAKEAGDITVKDGKAVIVVNPSKIKEDTIFHEFGHLYIELIKNKDLVDRGIALLRNCDLWNKVASLYPELSEEALAKEVLVTAIGIEASKLKDVDISKWQFWLNRAFRYVAELLGIETNVARSLAKDLITGNLMELIDEKITLETQHSKDLNIVNNVFMTKGDFLNKAANSIKKKIATYYNNLTEAEKEGNVNYQALKELETVLIDHANNDQDLGIVAFMQEMFVQTGKIESRLNRILKPTQEDIATGKDKITSHDLQQLIKYSSTFNLIDDIIDLMAVDETFAAFIKERNFMGYINAISTRKVQIANNAKRIGITLLSERLANRDNSKLIAVRAEELEREYNVLNEEARKTAKKDLTGRATAKYIEARRTFVANRLKAESKELNAKNAERFSYLLQQGNSDVAFLERMFLDGDIIDDELIQVVSEILDEADFNTMTASNAEYDKVAELMQEYEKDNKNSVQTKKYDKLLEDEVKIENGVAVKTGKKTKYMVSKYYSEFFKAKERVWKHFNETVEESGEDSPETATALQEALDWQTDNEVFLNGQFIPKGKWINPQWELMEKTRKADANDVTVRLYDYFLERLEKDSKNLPDWASLVITKGEVTWYKLPSIKKAGLEKVYEDGVVAHIKDRVKNTFKKEDSTDFGGDTAATVHEELKRTLSILTDEEGNEKSNVPVNFRYYVTPEEQSYDLASIILLNHSMVLNYENKQAIQADVELVRDYMKERKVVKQRGGFLKGGLTLIDKVLDTDLATPVTMTGSESNAYKALASIVEDRLYGIATRSSVGVTKVTNFIAGYTGNVLLVGNYLSAGANLTAGKMYNWMNRLGGSYYNAEDIVKAEVKYGKDIFSIVADTGLIRPKSKTNRLSEKFNNLGDWAAISNRFANDNRLKQKASMETLHLFNSLAEHSIQNVLMYAVLNNIKVKDANGQYLTADGTTDDITKAMTLDEAYLDIDGKLVLDPRVASTNKFDDVSNIDFIVSRYIRDITATLQGQYSNQKRSEIQRYWYGKLMMLLRKWLPRGITYRWRGAGTMFIERDRMSIEDVFHNRATQTLDEGYYVTTGRFLYTIGKNLRDLRAGLVIEESRKSMKAILKTNWNELTDQQQGNIQKTLREAITMLALYMMAKALKELADDDDDKDKLYVIAFYAIRLQKEMLTFVNPAEFTKTIKSPSAAIILVDRWLHLLSQLTSNPAEVYETGRRRGELKIVKDIEDVVPIYKHLDRDVEEALTWLMSRRVN